MLRRLMMAGSLAPANDPYWAFVKLLMHFNGADNSTTIVDQKGNAVTAFGNARIRTAESMFGGSSGYCDGTGDYFTIPSTTTLDFGSSDFCVEMFALSTTTPAYKCMICRNWGSSPYTGGWNIFYNGAGGGPMEVWAADYSTGAPLLAAPSATYRDGLWHHFAWVRNGNVHTLYIDGIAVVSRTTSFSFASVSKNFVIGTDLSFGGGARDFAAYMEDIRITIGVPRYTANFTPPAAQFPDS